MVGGCIVWKHNGRQRPSTGESSEGYTIGMFLLTNLWQSLNELLLYLHRWRGICMLCTHLEAPWRKHPCEIHPVTTKGLADVTRVQGSDGGSEVLYGYPIVLAHITHFCKILPTRCLMVGIQYMYTCHIAVTVIAASPWCSLLWVSSMIISVKACLCGNKYGNLVNWSMGAL